MAYAIGDPNHIDVHNALVADVQSAASRAGVTVVLPDPAALGDLGHTSDHNLIVDALALIAAAPPGGMPWAKVTGGTVTEYTKPDGSVMEVHRFDANGSLTVDTAGYAEILVCGAGAGGGQPGGGGAVRDGIRALTAGTVTVTVGVGGAMTGGAGGTQGGFSLLGTWRAGGGACDADKGTGFGGGGGTAGIDQQKSAGGAGGSSTDTVTPGPGIVSDITGTAVEYGKGGKNNTANGTLPGQGNWNSAGANGVVIVAVQKSGPTS